MRKLRATLITGAILSAAAWAAPARAATGYPYTLIDPGTLGGPSSFFDGGVPFTSDGTLIGSADTGTPDSALSNCPAGFCDGFQQHPFAWRDGRLTDLGVLPGATGGAVAQLNGLGVGAGASVTDAQFLSNPGNPAGTAVLFAHGQVTSLGFLPGGSESGAANINDQGQVSGASNNGIPDPFSIFGFSTQTRGFVWRDGVMKDLGSLGGPDTLNSWQNERGQIVGMSYTNDTPNPANNGFPSFAPFLWQNGHMINLGTLGGTLGAANWINDAGQVVGQSNLAGDENAHPFLWQNGKMIDLGTPDGNFGGANDINKRGDSAGAYFASDGNFHGILWRGRQMIDLPPVGDAPWAFGNALNDQDQVVGNEGVFNPNDGSFTEILASLWTRGHGYDLNTLVAPNPLQMTSADYIDDRGDIVGHGFMPDGTQRMFLLVRNPGVPLPATSTSRTALRQTLPATEHATSVLAPSGAGRSSSASRTLRWFLLDRRR